MTGLDTAGLRQLHRELCPGSTDAGEFRTSERSTGGIPHVAPEGIEIELDDLFDLVDLKMPGWSRSPDRLAKGIARTACSLAEILPFRDGNIKACRAMLGRAASAAGFQADWSAVTDAEVRAAAMAWCTSNDARPMRELASRCISGAKPYRPRKPQGWFARFLCAMRLPDGGDGEP